MKNSFADRGRIIAQQDDIGYVIAHEAGHVNTCLLAAAVDRLNDIYTLLLNNEDNEDNNEDNEDNVLMPELWEHRHQLRGRAYHCLRIAKFRYISEVNWENLQDIRNCGVGTIAIIMQWKEKWINENIRTSDTNGKAEDDKA